MDNKKRHGLKQTYLKTRFLLSDALDKEIPRIIIRLFYPPKCIVCNAILYLEDNSPFCEECAPKIRYIGSDCCYECGREKRFCTCRGEVHYTDRVIASLYYLPPVTRTLIGVKEREQNYKMKRLSGIVADSVHEKYKGESFDLIVTVPSSKKSIKHAGFDRMEEFGRHLSNLLRLEHSKKALIKSRETKKQHTLDSHARRASLRDSFTANAALIRSKNILLFDDTLTTGSTLDECARTLKAAGANRVCAATVAATLLKSRNPRSGENGWEYG